MAGGFEWRSSATATTTRGVEQVCRCSSCAFFQRIVLPRVDLRIRYAPQFSSSYSPSSAASSLHAIQSQGSVFFFLACISPSPGRANNHPAFYSENKAYALDSMISYMKENPECKHGSSFCACLSSVQYIFLSVSFWLIVFVCTRQYQFWERCILDEYHSVVDSLFIPTGHYYSQERRASPEMWEERETQILHCQAILCE